ncbi:hypothetical protein SADUNF_Sadunf17G0033100 [Salix dunnii]|uniref:Uncharacterized protein n=1 Tax=Salix dunnii TaxID=1413687 RepID=A0A835J4E3_9ROSI|nr:hypothetical protein SADUNF_Sadunf17G0033100 [Salix dunnii]
MGSCISAGMIAPISTCEMKCYKQSSMIPQQRGGICTSLFDHGCFSTVISNRRHGVKRGVVRRAKRERGQKEGCNTRTSQEVTHPSTTLAQARLTSEF